MSGVAAAGRRPEHILQEVVDFTSVTYSSGWIERAILCAKKAQVKHSISMDLPLCCHPVALDSGLIHKLLEGVSSLKPREDIPEELEALLAILSSLWVDLEDSTLRRGVLLNRYAPLKEMALYPLICQTIERATGCADGAAELYKNPRILLRLYLPKDSLPLKWLGDCEDMQWLEYLFAFYCIGAKEKCPLEATVAYVKIGFYEPLITNRRELEREVMARIARRFRIEFSSYPTKELVIKVASITSDPFKVAILKEWANGSPEVVIKNINFFNILESESLLEILMHINQSNPDLVASNIHLIGTKTEVRFRLAKQLISLKPSTLIAYLHAFQIGHHPEIQSILSPLVKINPWQISSTFELLGITDPKVRYAIALEMAFIPDFPLGQFFKFFKISDQAQRFEIAMRAAQFQVKPTLLYLSNFELNETEAYAVIEKAAFIHPVIVLKKLRSLDIKSIEFTSNLLQKLIPVATIDVMEYLGLDELLDDKTLKRLKFLCYYELARHDLIEFADAKEFIAAAEFSRGILRYPELFALELDFDAEGDRCESQELFQTGALSTRLCALRAMFLYTLMNLNEDQMTPEVQALLKQIMTYRKLPEALSLLETFCTLIQKGKLPSLLKSIEGKPALFLPMIWLTALEEFGSVEPWKAFLTTHSDLITASGNGFFDAAIFGFGQVFERVKMARDSRAISQGIDSLNRLTECSDRALSPHEVIERLSLLGSILLLNQSLSLSLDKSLDATLYLRTRFIEQLKAVPSLQFEKTLDFERLFFDAFGTVNLAHRFPIYAARIVARSNNSLAIAFSNLVHSVLSGELASIRYDSKYSVYFHHIGSRSPKTYWGWQEGLKQLFHTDLGNVESLKTRLLAIFDDAPFLFDEADMERLHALDRLNFEDQKKTLEVIKAKNDRSERKDHPLWIELQKILDPVKIGEIIETDGVEELILSATHMAETTLKWKYPEEPIRDFLEVILDGKHRLICIKDGEGKLIAYSIIKIVFSSEKKTGAILQEPIDKIFRKPFFERAFNEMTLSKARALKVSAFTLSSSGPFELYTGGQSKLCRGFSIDPDEVYSFRGSPLAEGDH